jgi:hypothetical protein
MDAHQLRDVHGWDAVGHEQRRLAAPQHALLDLVWAERRLDLRALRIGKPERSRWPAKVRPVRPVRRVEHATALHYPDECGQISDERN